jgi:hypothetical protein
MLQQGIGHNKKNNDVFKFYVFNFDILKLYVSSFSPMSKKKEEEEGKHIFPPASGASEQSELA